MQFLFNIYWHISLQYALEADKNFKVLPEDLKFGYSVI